MSHQKTHLLNDSSSDEIDSSSINDTSVDESGNVSPGVSNEISSTNQTLSDITEENETSMEQTIDELSVIDIDGDSDFEPDDTRALARASTSPATPRSRLNIPTFQLNSHFAFFT